MYFTDMHLGFETIPGLSGTGLGTLASRVGVGVIIPLFHVLQVSGRLYIIRFYSTGLCEEDWVF